MRKLTTISALLLATACNWGTRPDAFDFAFRPEGARVAVRVAGEKEDRLGELLASDSSGVVIRNRQTTIRIAWARVAAMDVLNFGREYDVHFDERADREKITRLALISRFPQGIAKLPITLDSLIAEAARATTRFTDRRTAVNEGYIRVGTDFPSMGEHWLNWRAVKAGRVDPAHPALLIYATVRDTTRFLGVGFVIVTRGDSVPRDAPGWPTAWHEHSGLLSDESGGGAATPRGENNTHVWVMHAWTVLDNPTGAFDAENWALPYLRAGVAVPRHVDVDESRGLSLAFGGDAFLSDVLSDAGLRDSNNAASVDSLIAVARTRVASSHAVAGDEWRSLSRALERLFGSSVTALLTPVHTVGHR